MPIRIFSPSYEQAFLPSSDVSVWLCHYQIEWPEGQRDSQGYGHDAVQALQLTFQKIGTELYASTYHRAGQLIWDKPGAGYGFPVPKAIRHMLVGDDAEYDG